MIDRTSAPSRATSVTFFEDRAEVTRRAVVTLAAGQAAVAVAGVTALVDDPSVVVRVVRGKARVVLARVSRRSSQLPSASADEIAAAERDLRAAERRSAAAERGLERAASRKERALALLEAWKQDLATVPRGFAEAAPRFRAGLDAVDAELVAALDQAADLAAELERARLDQERVRLRLSLSRAVHPRYETTVDVDLAAESAAAEEVELEIVYRTPCALWRPEHAARLVEDGARPSLTVQTLATVWQRTGEDWRGIVCRFSTARPASAASPPELEDDVLHLRKKSEPQLVVEARDETIHTASLEGGTRAVEEMPGVEDGGEPLCFEAARPVDIPSTGLPFRVELGEVTLPCEIELVAFPERSQAAHVRARATFVGKTPLLAGPVRLLRRREMVGRGRVAFVAPGDAFELGFGPDDGIRVRREVYDMRDTTPVIGTQDLLRAINVHVANLGGAPRRLVVVERVPRSEVEAVEVTLVERGGGKLDDKTGFLRFELELGAGATESRNLAYRVEASAKVRLPL